ncbi:hypothetical protein BDN70DRAFT_937995 [Pholiota conissans]|uniref:Uncharacterized protein n=1 Tax=Pholiota conissans TaxID=109636 RepID=A0A9P6CNC0_9AGAR|nr:hypothetical protein BDN70DRAFT_937995 [Pholiota conissans]
MSAPRAQLAFAPPLLTAMWARMLCTSEPTALHPADHTHSTPQHTNAVSSWHRTIAAVIHRLSPPLPAPLSTSDPRQLSPQPPHCLPALTSRSCSGGSMRCHVGDDVAVRRPSAASAPVVAAPAAPAVMPRQCKRNKQQ